MTKLLGLVVVAATALVGCSEDVANRAPMTRGDARSAGATATNATTQSADLEPECPSDVLPPTQLVKDKHASAVQLVGANVYYLSRGGLMKVGVDGTGPVTVVESVSLVHAWVQGENVLTVETGDDAATPDAVVRLIPLADSTKDDAGTKLAPPATWNAAGTKIFAADTKGFLLVGDEAKGQGVYQLDATTKAFTQLVETTTSVITSLQVTNDEAWYVRDNARVFHVARPGAADADDAKPTEAFAVDEAGCGLVVAGTRALCIQSDAIQGRDLDGKNPTPLFDLTKSRVPAGFSVGVGTTDAVVVAGSTAIRAIAVANGTERVLACAREGINSVDASQSHVAWTESTGVWLAPR